MRRFLAILAAATIICGATAAFAGCNGSTKDGKQSSQTAIEGPKVLNDAQWRQAFGHIFDNDYLTIKYTYSNSGTMQLDYEELDYAAIKISSLEEMSMTYDFVNCAMYAYNHSKDSTQMMGDTSSSSSRGGYSEDNFTAYGITDGQELKTYSRIKSTSSESYGGSGLIPVYNDDSGWELQRQPINTSKETWSATMRQMAVSEIISETDFTQTGYTFGSMFTEGEISLKLEDMFEDFSYNEETKEYNYRFNYTNPDNGTIICMDFAVAFKDGKLIKIEMNTPQQVDEIQASITCELSYDKVDIVVPESVISSAKEVEYGNEETLQ